MPRYLLAIISDDSPEAFANVTEEQLAEVMNAYNAFTQSIRDDGSYLAGEALQPSAGRSGGGPGPKAGLAGRPPVVACSRHGRRAAER